MYIYPVYKPILNGSEKQYVNECLDSTWISSKGKFISLFESTFSRYVNARYCASCSNGTVALHLALLALGINHNDEVIVPTLTYISSVNAISYVGAKPVFVDSEEKFWQMDSEDIKRKITPKTKAILVVHLYGHPCDMGSIIDIAKEHNLFVIEDCAEAFGAYYNNQHVGSFGDIATYSFFGNKTITTGEGGMVTTNNEVLYSKICKLKGQGLAENREYWHDIIGYNYRMTNIACAIGLAQLEKADSILRKKKTIAKWYEKYLRDCPVVFHQEAKNVKHSYWMCTILTRTSYERDGLREYLKQKGVETRPIFYPIHEMPMYSDQGEYPMARNLSIRGINLPSYPELQENDVETIVKTLHLYFRDQA